MNPSSAFDLIDVDDLRVGLYIHLDGGWMSHPFPLNSFRIASQEQIDTLRGLGLRQVRWCPDKSDPAGEPAPDTAAAPAAAPGGHSALVSRAVRAALEAQRDALMLCEQQFAEATGDWQRIAEQAAQQPQAAGEQAQALTRALVDKLLCEPQVCVRVLHDGAGDRSASHAVNVAVISLLMGKAFGLPAAEMAELGVGALLHDIGKIDLPERVRHRSDQASTAELRAYREHVARGVLHARRMGLAPGAQLIIGQHHEHVDGSGFPLGAGGERLSVASRIVALVNRYDNLCNPPLAVRALTPHEAVSLLFAQGKSKFDAAILGSFIRMMGVYPPGSAVQLTDERHALVVSVNASRPLKPRVLLHQPGVPREEALLVDLEHHPRLGILRSVKPQDLPPESMAYLAPRPRVSYFFEPARDTPVEAFA